MTADRSVGDAVEPFVTIAAFGRSPGSIDLIRARRDGLPAASLAALGLASAGLILYAGRDTVFFFDEWDFVLGRRGTSPDTLLSPHVGHLSVVPILAYKTLLATVGLAPYWPYRVLAVLMHLLCVGLVFAVARRRLGPWPALVPSVLLLFLGSAWQVLLWPFEVSYLASLAAGLGGWLLLDRRTRTADLSASALVAVALASSGVGVPIALGLLVRLISSRRDRERWALVAIPLGIYAIWLVAYGLPDPSPEGGVQLSNLPDTPRYMAAMAAAAAGGLAGLGDEWGRLVIAGFACLLVISVMRDGLTPGLMGALTCLLGFWALTGLGRADLGEPASSRYVYPSAAFLILVATEASLGLGTWRLRPRLGPHAALLASLIVAFCVLGNLAELRDGGRDLRDATDAVVPALAAVEVGGESISPDARPEPHFAPQIAAGPYLAAERDFGSAIPGGIGRVLGRNGDPSVADAALVRLEKISLAPAPDASAGAESSAPAVVQVTEGRVRSGDGCLRFVPGPVPAALDVRLPTGRTLVVATDAGAAGEIRLRRFSRSFPAAALGSLSQARMSVFVPDDRSSAPWIARISPAGPVMACLLS